ncbi:MAG: phospholipase D-like domain-containing protein [Candidatus Anammoxibacter sp.]
MLKKSKWLIIFFVIISTWHYMPQCYSFPAKNVIPLINDQYFPKVHKALREAKKSIFCVMYMVTLRKNNESGLVNTLIKDLIKAHKRGVEVKVIFDQNVPFWKAKKKKGYIERRSKDAYEKLLRAGVPVYYDDKNQITHNKVIVIDGYITIVGSTNWTYSAMNKNNEASVMIESVEVANEFTRRLRLVPRERVQE